MTKVTYDKQLTALPVIDPYNDFISADALIGFRGLRLPCGPQIVNNFNHGKPPALPGDSQSLTVPGVCRS